MSYYQSPIGLLEIKTNERAPTGIRVVPAQIYRFLIGT
jgi:hypothetical protein